MISRRGFLAGLLGTAAVAAITPIKLPEEMAFTISGWDQWGQPVMETLARRMWYDEGAQMVRWTEIGDIYDWTPRPGPRPIRLQSVTIAPRSSMADFVEIRETWR